MSHNSATCTYIYKGCVEFRAHCTEAGVRMEQLPRLLLLLLPLLATAHASPMVGPAIQYTVII